MKYIFPRQFRLHNVFTSETDTRETVQPFKDYTTREAEISRSAGNMQNKAIKIPKRLRGKAVELAQKLQNRNNKCSYVELLRYYCPAEVSSVPSMKTRTVGNTGIAVDWPMEIWPCFPI